MADRYQDRPFPGDDDRGGDPYASGSGDSDPLAELARLIGQTDPFGTMGRANAQVAPRPHAGDRYQQTPEPDVAPPAGPPAWMQRANRQEVRQEAPQYDDAPPEYPSAVHPLQRIAAARAAQEQQYQAEPQYAEEPDPSRYDDALYGRLDDGAGHSRHDTAYAEDGYAYQDGYDEEAEEQAPKRRGGMLTVVVVLALAIVGTGAAFAYRTYVGAPRSGEPPVIKADTSPTKIVPAQADGSAKVPDRMAAGDGTEKIVPREEAPVDVNAKAGPRVVFPPLNANGNPPLVASVAPTAPPPPTNAVTGTMPNAEPRKIRTLTVRGDQSDATTAPVASAPPAKPMPAARAGAVPPHNAPAFANASASAPLSLAPQTSQPASAAEPPRTRIAAVPAQPAPAAASSGGYVVQVSSQRNEADAQASFKALRGKFPSVLGSREPLIKRADLGEKGIYYRAMVGPFGTTEEASQFCGSLKTAGGQCVVQRN